MGPAIFCNVLMLSIRSYISGHDQYLLINFSMSDLQDFGNSEGFIENV
jgi:hypothetical protein